MRGRLILFILGLAVWLGLNWPLSWHDLLSGIFVAGLTAAIMGDMFPQRPHLIKRAVNYLWFLYYIPLFIWECLKANIEVAYMVVHPDLPIKPGIVKIKTSLKSDTALTLLANSITLTPGTMSVDIDKEKGYIYIHWINVAHKDIESATEAIAAKFENVLKRMFE